MRNRLRGNELLATLVIFLASTFTWSQTRQNRQTVDEALEGSKISVTLEGIEDGKSLHLVITNLSDSNLALILPKGNLDFDLGRATLTVLVDRQIAIDLETKKTYKATLPQVGKMRVKEGKVTLRQTADGLERRFENLTLGPSESK
jgi:hypothetical protein